MKSGARENDLFDRIAADPLFSIDRASIEAIARAEDYVGLSKQQTERFLAEEIDPLIAEVQVQATEELRV